MQYLLLRIRSIAKELYDKGEYEESWKYCNKKGLEFIAKYGDRGYITLLS